MEIMTEAHKLIRATCAMPMVTSRECFAAPGQRQSRPTPRSGASSFRTRIVFRIPVMLAILLPILEV
jgi:hypothetical protein